MCIVYIWEHHDALSINVGLAYDEKNTRTEKICHPIAPTFAVHAEIANI